jgi:hypothetical protein
LELKIKLIPMQGPPPLVQDYSVVYTINFCGDEKNSRAVFNDDRLESLCVKSSIGVSVFTHTDLAKCSSDILVAPIDCVGNIMDRTFRDRFGAAINSKVKKYVCDNHHGYLPLGKAFIISMRAFSETFAYMMCVPIRTHVNIREPYDLHVFNTVKTVMDYMHSSDKFRSVTFPEMHYDMPPYRAALQTRVAIDTFLGEGVNRENSKNLFETMKTIRNINNIKLIYT